MKPLRMLVTLILGLIALLVCSPVAFLLSAGVSQPAASSGALFGHAGIFPRFLELLCHYRGNPDRTAAYWGPGGLGIRPV